MANFLSATADSSTCLPVPSHCRQAIRLQHGAGLHLALRRFGTPVMDGPSRSSMAIFAPGCVNR